MNQRSKIAVITVVTAALITSNFIWKAPQQPQPIETETLSLYIEPIHFDKEYQISRYLKEIDSEPTPKPLPTATPSPSPIPTVTPTPIPYIADLDLFARLIYCEAGGEGDDAMYAVGQVVMNRMSYYDMTLKETIYEHGVFSPVGSGFIDTVKASKEARAIALRLLQGYKYAKVEDSLFFCTVACYNKRGWHYTSSHGSHPTTRVVCTIGTTIFLELTNH